MTSLQYVQLKKAWQGKEVIFMISASVTTAIPDVTKTLIAITDQHKNIATQKNA